VDRNADSAAFLASVATLFTISANLEDPAMNRPSLLLSFYKAHRRSRSLYIERRKPLYTYCIEKDSFKCHSTTEQQKVKALSGCFELVHLDAVPSVQGVTMLGFQGNGRL
jgi:hypothetical protein